MVAHSQPWRFGLTDIPREMDQSDYLALPLDNIIAHVKTHVAAIKRVMVVQQECLLRCKQSGDTEFGNNYNRIRCEALWHISTCYAVVFARLGLYVDVCVKQLATAVKNRNRLYMLPSEARAALDSAKAMSDDYCRLSSEYMMLGGKFMKNPDMEEAADLWM
jgi:hypothetical protein